jgi:YesN/AraC family two-component response regulator
MKKIKILIVDDNEIFVDTLKEYFNNNNDFEVIGTASNGKDGIELITPQNQPQAVILDNVMPNYDGTYFLLELQKLDIPKPIIISTSNYIESGNSKVVNELGVDYFMAKPCDYEILARIIKMLVDDKAQETSKDLMEVFDITRRGTVLIRKAIELVINNPGLMVNIHNIFKKLAEIYPDIDIKKIKWNIDKTIERTWAENKKEISKIMNIRNNLKPNLAAILNYYLKNHA